MSPPFREIRQAIVLAGGLGSRLGSLTQATPKPLLDVDGRPFLAYLLEWLARSGIDRVIISTGYLPDAFAGFIHANSWRDPYQQPIKVEEAREKLRAGTGGALALMRDRLDERFLVVNGDTFFDCDLAGVLGAADRLPSHDTMIVARQVEDASSYGRMFVGPGGRVLRFVEKGRPGAGLINAGVSVLNRDIVDSIAKIPCSLEEDIYPALAASDRLLCCERSGYFIDIGLPDTYARAQTELPAALRKPAVFFDRDGVLNLDKGYTHRTADLVFMPGAAQALKIAREAGYLTVVISNQAGVAKGLFDETAVENFHRSMNSRLRSEGAWIDAFYYCPFHPEAVVDAYRRPHPDRKPEPGMILRAARELGIDLQSSVLVGDKETDLEAARRAGIPGYLFTTGSLDTMVTEILSPKSTGARDGQAEEIDDRPT